MKKKIVCFLLIIVILMMNSVCLYADESTVGSKKYTYTMEYVSIDSYGYEVKDGEAYIHIVKGQGTIESDYKLVAYRVSGTPSEVCIVLLNDDGSVYKNTGRFLGTLGNYTTMSGYTEYGIAYLDTLEFEKSKFSSYYSSNNTLTGYLVWYEDAPYWKKDSPGKLITNIPIFENYSEACKYMSGELTVKDATNSSDVIKHEYDSPDVPVAKNVKVCEDNEKYYLTWDQDIEDMKKLTSVRIKKTIIAEEYDRIDGQPYPHYPHIDTELIDAALSHKLDLTALILNIHKFYLSHNICPYRFTLDIELINRWEKSDVEIHDSNVVHAYITVGYTVKDGLSIEVEYTETDNNGNYVPDSSYNDYGDGSGLLYDNNFTVIDGSGNIFKAMTNGFGLLQTGGLIDLLTSAFSFIPADIWSIIASGVSILILVGIVKMAVK